MSGRLTALDLCCGAGGWAVAARGLPIRIVAAVDHAWDCCRTYAYNHPDARCICADLLAGVDWSRFAGVDLILGGIPCEQISLARNNRQLSTPDLNAWHRLLDGALDIVDRLQPPWWCIENVMGMRRHVPPLTPYAMLDSAGWSGTRRKRMFMGRYPTPATKGHASNFGAFVQPGPYFIHTTALRCTKVSRGQCYGSGAKRVLDRDRPAPTITDCGTRNVRGFIVRLPDGRERVLQFTEAARLQGYPDDYVFVAAYSRAWKMVVQSIQIDLGRAILEAIVREAGL